MVVILLLTVGVGVLLDRPCMVFQCVCCACVPSVHLDVPSIGVVNVCVCQSNPLI